MCLLTIHLIQVSGKVLSRKLVLNQKSLLESIRLDKKIVFFCLVSALLLGDTDYVGCIC